MFLLLQCCARWFHFNPFRISVKAIEREQCCTAAASALTVVRWASLPPVQTISITSSLSGLIWLFAASYLTFYAKKEIPDARSCCVLIQLEAVDGSWFISLAKQLMGVTIIYSEQTRARHYHFWPLLLLLLTCGWEMLRLQSKSTGNDLRAVALCPEVAALVRVPPGASMYSSRPVFRCAINYRRERRRQLYWIQRRIPWKLPFTPDWELDMKSSELVYIHPLNRVTRRIKEEPVR